MLSFLWVGVFPGFLTIIIAASVGVGAADLHFVRDDALSLALTAAPEVRRLLLDAGSRPKNCTGRYF